MRKEQIEKHVDKFDIVIESAEKQNYLNFSILSTEIWEKKLEINTYKFLVFTCVVSHFEKVIYFADSVLFDQIKIGFGVFFTR